jgi:hypothetical protein
MCDFIETALTSLCDQMRVDLNGLTRQALQKDPQLQRGKESISALLNVLLDDNSVEDVLNMIVKAAAEPEWEVSVYWTDESNVKHHYNTTTLRCVTHTGACNLAIEDMRDERVEVWTAEAKLAQGSNLLDDLSEGLLVNKPIVYNEKNLEHG